MSWARGRGKSRLGWDMDWVSVPSMTPGGGEEGGMRSKGAIGGMGPLQSSSVGPSETTTSAGCPAFLGRVIRLQREQPDEPEEQEELDMLLQPAARPTDSKLKVINRLQDIVIPRFPGRLGSPWSGWRL
jgi:hypothetical protein